MKSLLWFISVTWVVSSSLHAAERYDRDSICKNLPRTANCALHIEQAISKDVPGVIQRKGLVLTISARNGKQLFRKNSPPFTDGGISVYVCNYLPKFQILQLCHYLNETLKTEYFLIENGNSVSVPGFPKYSPSTNRAVLVGSYHEVIGSIVILRFKKGSIVHEFEYTASQSDNRFAMGISGVSWSGENKITFGPALGTKPNPFLEETKSGWVIRENN